MINKDIANFFITMLCRLPFGAVFAFLIALDSNCFKMALNFSVGLTFVLPQASCVS